MTLSSTKPTRTGYSFLGWSTSTSATSATYTAGGSYTTNSSTTLYAVWKVNTYTVTYNANGGTGAPEPQTKTYGQVLQLTTTIPTRTGYTFLGWTSITESDLVEYEKGDHYYYDSSVTLYAIWAEDQPAYMPGDINGDNTVNNKDLTRLMKYLAGEDVSVTEYALDINGDGTVNNKDLTRLMKYLAGEDVEII